MNYILLDIKKLLLKVSWKFLTERCLACDSPSQGRICHVTLSERSVTYSEVFDKVCTCVCNVNYIRTLYSSFQ